MINITNVLTNLKQSSFIIMLLCAIALLTISQPAYAQISEFKVTANDASGGDNFGSSVFISGDYAIVGAWFDEDGGTQSGSA